MTVCLVSPFKSMPIFHIYLQTDIYTDIYNIFYVPDIFYNLSKIKVAELPPVLLSFLTCLKFDTLIDLCF